MHPPIKNFTLKKYPNGSITQWFGENPDLYRPWGLTAHNGIDIVSPWGTPMCAIEDGQITDVKLTAGGYGKHVRLRSTATTDGLKREWVYGHCSEIYCEVGQLVQAGDHIADMGNTGFVVSGATPWWKHNPYAGTHLHLGVRWVKEGTGWRWNDETPRIEVQNYDNGYKGAVDPAQFFTDPISDKRQKMLTIISLQRQLIKLLEKLRDKK